MVALDENKWAGLSVDALSPDLGASTANPSNLTQAPSQQRRFCRCTPPPTIKDLIETLPDFQLPSVLYEEPYYEFEELLGKPPEGGKVVIGCMEYEVEVKRVDRLPEFWEKVSFFSPSLLFSSLLFSTPFFSSLLFSSLLVSLSYIIFYRLSQVLSNVQQPFWFWNETSALIKAKQSNRISLLNMSRTPRAFTRAKPPPSLATVMSWGDEKFQKRLEKKALSPIFSQDPKRHAPPKKKSPASSRSFLYPLQNETKLQLFHKNREKNLTRS